jgi:hypothetical protein
LFPVTTRIAAVANAVAPELTADILSMVNRLLPSAGEHTRGRRRGAESQSRLSPSWLTRLGDRAARKYNQISPAERGTA